MFFSFQLESKYRDIHEFINKLALNFCIDATSKTTSSAGGKSGTTKSGSATSPSRNLWVSGLSTLTRATDLKIIFSKYGKVIGAKVVTNTRTPGSRCYGYVTMNSSSDAAKCISHLHRTELHGRIISVERAKSDIGGLASKAKPVSEVKKDAEVKTAVESRSEGEKDTAAATVKAEVKTDGEKSGAESTDDRKSIKADPDKKSSTRSTSRTRRANLPNDRVTEAERARREQRNRVERRERERNREEILSFQKIREERDRQRLRERERKLREEERRRAEARRRQRDEEERLMRERERLKKERIRLEREKADLLRLERERQKLEREKLELERLEIKRQQLKYEIR